MRSKLDSSHGSSRRVPSIFRSWVFRVFLLLLIVTAWVIMSLERPDGSSSPRSKTSAVSFRAIELSGAKQRKTVSSPFHHLIIVPGHSVMNIDSFISGGSDAAWKLLDYQEHQGLPDIILSHINKAIDLLSKESGSLLIFSGGQTRIDAGPVSEGLSYYVYSKKMNLLVGLDDRVFIEEFSRDSYENLLFSICRFREVTGVYPSAVTVVGFDFKETRYSDLHRVAIDYPLQSFKYIGIKPDTPNFDHDAAVSGESKTIEAFKANMYGCDLSHVSRDMHLRGSNIHHKNNSEPGSAEIVAKRIARNPFKRTIPYELSCPEIKSLLAFCGPGLFANRHYSLLPWND